MNIPLIKSKDNIYKVSTYTDSTSYEQETIHISLSYICLKSKEGDEIELPQFSDIQSELDWIRQWTADRTHAEMMNDLARVYEAWQFTRH